MNNFKGEWRLTTQLLHAPMHIVCDADFVARSALNEIDVASGSRSMIDNPTRCDRRSISFLLVFSLSYLPITGEVIRGSEIHTSCGACKASAVSIIRRVNFKPDKSSAGQIPGSSDDILKAAAVIRDNGERSNACKWTVSPERIVDAVKDHLGAFTMRRLLSLTDA